MSSARVEAARYVSRGAAGYVLEDERMEVVGAGYETAEEAEKVCMQLEAAEEIACSVVSVGSPETVLRMTAGSGQIASFLKGEQALRSAAGALGQLAFSIDRGEANGKQASLVIESQLRKTESAAQALTLQAGESGNGVFSELLTLLAEMNAQMEQMLSETSAMALSSRLKYAHVDFRVREIKMLNDMMG